ncbi:MAG: hydroxymethylpyrimidine/phosphomethylpyrimidine kinase [Archaeoglobaceae archaeon]
MNILILAGLDPSGGAGIAADVKAARALDCHALPIVTALTVQNTCDVARVASVDAEIVAQQLDAVLEDVEVHGVKVGLVSGEEVAEVLASKLKKLKVPRVLDPVIFAGSGAKIGSVEAYKILLQCVDVVTPNLTEAKILSGKDDLLSAGRELRRYARVIVTGGELGGRDHVFEEREYVVEAEFSGITIHGTGCVYSTALACYLARGKSLEDAARLARLFTLESVKRALRVGRCYPCVNP